MIAHDLALSRGGIPVLSGVSFSLLPGRALILRGPNGIGKTTLLRALAGLQPLDSGTVDAQDCNQSHQWSYCINNSGED